MIIAYQTFFNCLVLYSNLQKKRCLLDVTVELSHRIRKGRSRSKATVLVNSTYTSVFSPMFGISACLDLSFSFSIQRLIHNRLIHNIMILFTMILLCNVSGYIWVRKFEFPSDSHAGTPVFPQNPKRERFKSPKRSRS